MRGGTMRPGAAAVAIGTALLVGAGPVATARPGGTAPAAAALPDGTGPAPESPQETAPESTFNIFGLVESPGRYDWSAGMTVGRAVSAAGGTPTAALRTICRFSEWSTGGWSRGRSRRTIRCSRTT